MQHATWGAPPTLVAPYLAYMRQDIAFHPGEAVSQRIVGPFLASLFDAVVSNGPHLHRVATLEAGARRADRSHRRRAAAGRLDCAAKAWRDAHGPDGESAQWVAQAAERHGFDFAVRKANAMVTAA